MSFKVNFKHSHPPNVFCELTLNVTGVIILLIPFYCISVLVICGKELLGL